MNAGVCTAASTSPLASTWSGVGVGAGGEVEARVRVGSSLGLAFECGGWVGVGTKVKLRVRVIAREHLVPRCGVVGAEVLPQPGVACRLGSAADDHLVKWSHSHSK